MLRKCAMATLLAFCITLFPPSPVHASFFLFNIIRGIFGGGHQDTKPPPAATPSGRSNLIQYGMNGSQVKEVQELLIKAHYLGGSADGMFGRKTLQAVTAFQDDSGLAADGVVGAKTLKALKNYRGSGPKNKSASKVKPPSRPPQNRGGAPSYLYTLPMVATAYTANDEGCTGITYAGHTLRRGLVAVDPDVIPLGTKLFVPGYGDAVADDIGGAIQGNRIDLAMDSLDEAFEYGVRDVTVYVLP